MKKELKTLKDISGMPFALIPGMKIIYTDELKALTIEWVKEDFETIEAISKGLVVSADYFTRKWMKRLNISEEDLK